MKLWMVSFVIIAFIPHFTWAIAILEKVTTKFDEDRFVAELIFNKSPDLENVLVEYINQTVQVNIPKATVRSGKHLSKVNDHDVKSVYSYQFDKDTLRTRIIYDNHIEASAFEGFVKLSKKGKVVTIAVLNPDQIKSTKIEDVEVVPPLDIEKALSVVNSNVVNSNIEKSAQDILRKETGVPKSLPEKKVAFETFEIEKGKIQNKNAQEKTNKKIESAKSSDDKLFAEKLSEADIPVFKRKEAVQKSESSTALRLAYSLFVIVLFASGLLVFARWWNKNHKINDKNTKIKVLTQHHLGPRKSLAIVRVAGESILIGVTDSNINMIKTLSFIDDEINEDLPVNFNQTIDLENNRPDDDVKMQKVTYSPDIDLVKDLRQQIAGKLKNLKDI